MNKLIYANFGRLKKDLVFWLCNLFMLFAGTFASLKAEVALDEVFFIYAVLIGLVSSVFCGMFIGTEHGDGTIRNKFIIGHSRVSVYYANLIVCILAGFLFCLAFIIPMLTIGSLRLGFFEMKVVSVVALLGISLVLSAAYSGVFTLISMLCNNKAVIAVGCILCFIALLGIGASVNTRLQEPEFVNNYVTSIDGMKDMKSEPNPNYLTGTERELYQFALDFIPTGQSLQFVEMTMIHPWQMPLYSFIILGLTSTVGIVLFKRKDIK